jgi:hypothetical protein
LSTVLSLELEREPEDDDLEPDLFELEREELLRADLAIASSPSDCGERHFKAVPVP